ncbi:MAG: HEAT repeat domain-containing protein, partial [bacterium]
QKIKNGLNSTDSEVQITSAKLLDNAPVTKTLSLIEEGLNHSNPEVQKISAENIRFAPENMIANLIRECLKHPNPKVQVESVKIIERAFGDERSTLIREGLSHSNPEVQITSALMMGDAPKDEITLLIKDGFNHPNPEVQKISAENIRFAPVNERASLIREGLSHSNLEIQILSVDNINFVSEPEKPSLWKNVLLRIRQSLESVDPKVQTSSIGMIDYIPKNERKGLYKLMKEKGLEEYLIKPALYKNGAVRKEKFSRANFDKTGSETILLGGDLKDKTIIREITPEAFLSWQSIYENWKLWQQAGFDYVPIEPIQSFSINKNGSIRVYSGVLDLSLARWKEISTKFESELEEQKNKIKAVLSSINFEHGHPHDGNFCLRFFRNENGKPDFNRFPRLYLIDFDQAFSPGK